MFDCEGKDDERDHDERDLRVSKARGRDSAEQEKLSKKKEKNY